MTNQYIPIFPAAIDNSMRKELVKCQTAAKYRYEMGLKPAGEGGRVDLIAGAAYAKGLEIMRKSYYDWKVPAQASLEAGIAACYAQYGNFVPPPKSNKTADRMAGALAYYVSQFPLEDERYVPFQLPDGKWTIEMMFSYPMGLTHPVTGEELEYCGNFDALVIDRLSPLHDAWVCDEKTTSQMGEKWVNQWPLDSQMTGYCWGARKLLQEHGMDPARVKGAIINGIAIRMHDYGVMRLPVYRHDWEIERWYGQMLSDVTRWTDAHIEQNHNMALDHACAFYNNPCDFATLCLSKNPERLYQGSYVVERWNPKERK